jgi:hypothetical protein
MSTSKWIIVIALCALLGLGAGVIARVLLRRKRYAQQEANEREIARSIAEAGAQESLNHLYTSAKGLFGVEYVRTVERLMHALDLLGDTDRNFAEKQLPDKFVALAAAAQEYNAIMSERSVCDNDVNVHTSDSSGTYTSEVYAELTRTAWALAMTLPPLQGVREEVIDLCVTIEQAAAFAPRRCAELKSETDIAGANIKAHEAAGYKVQRLKNMLKATRGFVTRAEGAVRSKDFLQAQGFIATTEHLLGVTQRNIKMLLDLQRDLEQRLELFDSVIEEALNTLGRADARQQIMAGRYTIGAVQPLRGELQTLLEPAASLPAKVASVLEKLADLDVFAAAEEAMAIDALLENIRQIDEKTSKLMHYYETAKAAYRALRPDVVRELTALEQAIETRKSQGHQRRAVRALREQFANAERRRRTRPLAAHAALLTLRSNIAHRNELSLAAHENAINLTE